MGPHGIPHQPATRLISVYGSPAQTRLCPGSMSLMPEPFLNVRMTIEMQYW